jgi:hypothetical protein
LAEEMMHLMSSKKESSGNEKPPVQATSTSHKLYHAMRNGTLYRSSDGVNWEIETDPDISSLPEGTSRVTRPAKEHSQKK